MSGLLDSLSTATNSLIAQRMGMDVAGQNMANINTAGYARRTLTLAELPPTDYLNAGRGVTVLGIRAMRDELVESRLRREQSDTAYDGALAGILSTAEAAIGLPGESLDVQLAALFDALSALASDPTSLVARDTVVRAGQELGSAFGDLVGRLTDIQQDADRAIRASVLDINGVAAELAGLNRDLSTASYDVESIRDRQGVLLSRLAELADVAVIARADGGVDVTLPSGRALVLGDTAYPLSASSDPLAAVSLGDADVTADFTGGQIGGLLHARDIFIPGYIGRLDQLAFDVATAMNGVHAAGFDLTGAAAGNFFVPPGAIQGAASNLTVDPVVAADSARVAASATGAVGDNGIARALAQLRDSHVASGGTRSLYYAWSQVVYAAGADTAAARASAESHSGVVTQLEQLRAESSGVSLDEEAANLMRYQRAYEANARYFTTILDTIDALMEMVR